MSATFEKAIALAWGVFGDHAFRPVREGAVHPGEAGTTAEEEAALFEQGEVNVALWCVTSRAWWEAHRRAL